MAKKHNYYAKSSPYEEAFRNLRTNIQFSAIDKELKALVITSTNPSEGKTSIATNLAMSFAQNGEKVILVDCDMRNPSVSKHIDINQPKGLTNILVNKEDPHTVMVQHEGVDIIFAGPIPPNPAELIGSRSMENLLENLKHEYDYVLLDTPPAGMLTDGAILSSAADGTILVIAEGETERADLGRTIEQIKNVGGNIIGVVMNKVKSVKSSNYGKYY